MEGPGQELAAEAHRELEAQDEIGPRQAQGRPRGSTGPHGGPVGPRLPPTSYLALAGFISININININF